ncbi:MAG: L,D-transpeptidase family protein [Syntrophomonadaceae bacterium]
MRYRGVVLILMAFIICLAALVRDGQANDKPREEVPMTKIDRTDFPVLWLSEPNLQGEATWMIQARLKELGYEITPTGIYDYNTSESIRLFQTANNLKADGIVNQKVWEKLMINNLSTACVASPQEKTRKMIEIDISKHQLILFENGKIIKQYPVGVGKSSTPSPLGEWKVINKGRNWGNGFGTRWMGLNVPWGIYGIHGTNKPYSIGASMSHGCIRMQNRHVEELYPLVPVGTMVRIVENGKMFPDQLQPVKIQKNSSGQKVVYVQSRLKELGIIFDNADGRFGSMTELAVKYYQAWHNLEPTGVVDAETYRSLGMIK